MAIHSVIINKGGHRIEIQVDDSIFRAYDIRAIAEGSSEQEVTLTPEIAYAIGQAIGSEMIQEHGQRRVIVGCDARRTSPNLSRAMIEGLMSTGCQVTCIGQAPTPVVHYAIEALKIPSSVTITASHHPMHYNGIKIVVNGEICADKKITGLFKRIQEGRIVEGEGSRENNGNVLNLYIKRVLRDIKLSRTMKIVVDPLHGITGLIAEELFERLDCEVTMLHQEVLPDFGGLVADPIQPENIRELTAAVISQEADLGLAFDCDGDRIGVVTKRGKLISTDQLLMLLAKHLPQVTKGSGVIFDVKCSKHLADIIVSKGATPYISRAGRPFILQKMQRDPTVRIGCEKTGHIFLSESVGGTGYDDGLLAAVILLQMLSRQEQSLDDLVDELPVSHNTPELALRLPTDDAKWTLMERIKGAVRFDGVENIITIDGLRVEYADSWGLVRPSNTSAKLVFVFEADSEAALKAIQQRFAEQILAIDPGLVLPFEHQAVVEAKTNFAAHV